MIIPICFPYRVEPEKKEEHHKDLTYFYETNYTLQLQGRLGPYIYVLQNCEQDVKLIYLREELRQMTTVNHLIIETESIDVILETAKLMEKEYEKKRRVCK